MKIALLLAGYTRTFYRTFPSLYENVLRHYKPDVFINTWDKTDSNSKSNVNQHSLIELYRPTKCRFDLSSSFVPVVKPNPKDSIYIQNVQPAFYSLMRCHQLKESYEKENGLKYDVVIRCRFDVHFLNKLNIDRIDNKTVYVNSVGKNSRRGYCNDHFGYGNNMVMTDYCNTYIQTIKWYLEKQKLDLLPEMLLFENMLQNGIKITLLRETLYYLNREDLSLVKHHRNLRYYNITEEMVDSQKGW